MNALRLAAAATIASATLIAAALGACNNVINLPVCGIPTLDEKAADGGPDPCHCDPAPSLNLAACGCLSDPSDQTSIDEYQSCMYLFHGQQDAGDGGP